MPANRASRTDHISASGSSIFAEQLMSVVTAETRAEPGVIQPSRGKARFWEREAPLAYLFMIPGLVILLLFMAYPFFLGIYLSMTDKMVGFADFNFVWFENFQLLLRDQIFHRTVANTLIYSFITVPFKLFLGLGLALVLNQTFHFSRFIRAGLLLPFIVPTAISSLADPNCPRRTSRSQRSKLPPQRTEAPRPSSLFARSRILRSGSCHDSLHTAAWRRRGSRRGPPGRILQGASPPRMRPRSRAAG